MIKRQPSFLSGQKILRDISPKTVYKMATQHMKMLDIISH